MLYDLSQPTFHDAPQWATHSPITLTLTNKMAVDGCNVEQLELSTHSGTHLDAPLHFIDRRRP